MTTIEERVTKGVEWLDSERPGWTEHINLRLLDLAHCHRCVLGQLFDDFDLRPTELRPLDVAALHGFERESPYQAEYADLTAEWRRVITSRREAAR